MIITNCDCPSKYEHKYTTPRHLTAVSGQLNKLNAKQPPTFSLTRKAKKWGL